ncbi:MAG TPA: carboxypeptidase-like regulatory domain-containing protein [Longimicrobium sp.]|nr:carboxypeptidase-like regulatory domain-containing protein [Longimicrobium sp.]
MNPLHVVALSAALIAAAPLAHAAPTPSPVDDAARVQASLEVTVRGASGQAVPGATVRIGDRPEVTTDTAGRARVPGVAAGTYRVTVAHASLGTRTATVTLPADAGSLELRAQGDALAATVQRAVALAGVTGTAQRNPALETLGFYQRMEKNPGQFVTEDQIQSRRAGRMTDVLRRLKGIRLLRYSENLGMSGSRSTADLSGEIRVASSRGSTGISRVGPCWMDVYMNGVQVQDGAHVDQAQNLDDIATSTVIAMEVYQPSEIPTEYRSSTSTCGVILIWTRR